MASVKFNKEKCLNCKYASVSTSYATSLGYRVKDKDGIIYYVMCDYACKTGETCLKKDGTDIRGDEYNNCKLYSKTDKRETIDESNSGLEFKFTKTHVPGVEKTTLCKTGSENEPITDTSEALKIVDKYVAGSENK